MELNRHEVEKTGAAFAEEKILQARARSWEAVNAIAARIEVGMREEDGLAIANETLKEMGAEKKWHRTWVRFGANTVKQYGAPSEPETRLSPSDLYFVDIGPIWDGYEGDAGATFVVGHDADMWRCVADSKAIFDDVRAEWRKGSVTGAELYRFANDAAESRGWLLNLDEANGHRLSDFPHALYFRGAISDLPFTPAPARWVLEIQLRHRERPFGSFYEDLLV